MMSPENSSRVESSDVEMSSPKRSPQPQPQPHEEEDSLEEQKSPAAETKSTKNDVAKFDGKIVYNPDGSAYIIEDGDMLDDDDNLPLPKQEGSFVELAGRSPSASSAEMPPSGYPQIANAFYVSRSSAYYNALYGGAYAKLLQGKNVPETPVVHSYRVMCARKQHSDKSEEPEMKSKSSELASSLPTVVPVKPILMCFICKLSFGCSKTFASHCVEAHSMDLTEEENSKLDSENSSAILQCVGKEKELTLSFLEPFISTAAKVKPPLSPGAITNFLSALASSGLPLGSAAKPTPSSEPSVKSEPKITMLPPSRLFPQLPPSGMPDETRNSPSSISPADTPTSQCSGSPSPVPSMAASFGGAFPSHLLGGSSSNTPTNANMLQGTTIGACPEHMNGRPTGVECSKCDLILNSSRLAGGSTWNMSRNSCKTLKCPKCNWHYKYQETLEIHMKEKHPESETTCIYCITGQQHPRLARGETYTCGYKPYRCEVCNYSTTTKGNLSIHMQSDKHLNNIQDLQNGTATNPAMSTSPVLEPPKMPQSPVSSQRPPSSNASLSVVSPSKLQQQQPQKPNWRCDVCNYETNVARNLRIHMTSEKHTHNMMALQQQSAKGLQQLSALHLAGAGGPSMDPKQFLGGLFGNLPPPPSLPTASGSSSEAALADLAFNQAVLAQLMAGSQNMPPIPSLGPDFNLAAMAAAMAAQGGPGGRHPGAMPDLPDFNTEPPMETKDPNPKNVFTCCVCRVYGCDNIDDLTVHLSHDRSRTRENEVSIVIGGNYLCHLCNYRTNLKANFQLHCKTDKHLQRLSHVNHIKEGGPDNEWKLRFLTTVNPVDLRCNACDFQTNSPHKMQVHVANQQHQVSAILFSHLQHREDQLLDREVPEERISFDCALCKYSTSGKASLMSHVRTVQHLQMEQMHQLQKRAEGNNVHTEISDIFQVTDNREEETSKNDKDDSDNSNATTDESDLVTCPLCQEKFDRQSEMESHAMSVHSVNQEGLQRLQSLINGSHWLNQNQAAKQRSKSRDDSEETEDNKREKGSEENKHNNNNNEDENVEDERRMSLQKHVDQLAAVANRKLDPSPTSFSYSIEKYLDPNRPFKCDVCKESFTQKNILLVHYNSVSHLHKLKKIMQEQQNKKDSGDVEVATPEKTPPLSKGSALEALLGNIRGEKKEDEEAKLFKCNICKVAYSQGSTLDIHVRSVLHQGRASRLQELILTGQIDMNKPLIEHPDAATLQQLEQQKKQQQLTADLLSPKSLNSTGSSNPRTSPTVNRSSSPNRSSPQSSPLANLQSIMANKANISPTDPSSSSDESAFGNLTKTFPFLPSALASSTPDKKAAAAAAAAAASSPVLKNLLQNYGFDIVKQFSDIKKQNDSAEKKFKCPVCGDHFSNVWLLKGHGEEVHKDSHSQDMIERYLDNLNNSNNDDITDSKDRSSPSSVTSEGQEEKNESVGNFQDVQEAFQRAMMNAQLQQMNPLLMQMAQLQGLNPLLAMNLHPPLIPPNLLKQNSGMDMPSAFLAQLQSTQQLLSGNQPGHPMGLSQLFQGGMDPKLLALMSASRQQQMDLDSKPPASVMSLIGQSQSSPSQASADSKNMLQLAQMGLKMPDKPNNDTSKLSGLPQPPQQQGFGMSPSDSASLMLQQQQNQEKRARTRITDDQLKVLRANFDINNSPAEEQLNTMSAQTGLPLKVIKHWFRNTLFKERQKNKDSPYNFNNPPSTKLNLEEYEKTGEPKVTQLHPDEQAEYVPKENSSLDRSQNDSCEPPSSPEPPAEKKAKHSDNSSANANTVSSNHKVPNFFANDNSPDSNNLTLSRLLSVSQLSGLPPLPSQPLLPNFPAFPPMPTTSASSPLMPEYLNSLSKSPRPLSPSMSMSGGSGKRANRTRFTDYQIKVLQEFFENNAYPKDDDLEYLSKLLGLSPRVIVVWFQNARQKARKIYENQPPPEQTVEEDTGRFTRTAGCNYQCKKCLLVFQRYYELIRHQKQHCYKEEDAKRSAQAQKAAAHAAAQFSGSHQQMHPSHSEDSKSSIGDDRGSMTSPICSTPSIMEASRDERHSIDDNRAMFFNRTNMVAANPSAVDMEDTFSKFMQQQQLKYPANSPFGILQQQALQQHQQQLQREELERHDEDSDEFDDSDSIVSTPSSKRKLYDDGDMDNEESLHQKEKRLRTTILPEQLDFLYQKYAQDSNPSRKMLEQIAGEVGLRKRVVQVWFQNTRARERKGQFRSHTSLVINKRCPCCPEIFKMRSALEAHLATMHPNQPLGMIDIDALPNLTDHSDDEDEDQRAASPLPATPQIGHTRPSLSESPFPMMSDQLASLLPNANASTFDLQNSMRKYYEDTMKRFMNDISEQQKKNNAASGILNHNEALDLSMEDGDYAGDGDSDNNKSMGETESNGGGSFSGGHGGSGGGGSGNKRFRTQMSGLQVKMMKSVFEVYKTPTMTECSNLGRDIGLQKRVVQVWFQNARAKEKRAKLQLQQLLGREPEQPPPPEECTVCNFKYGPKFVIQDHIFNKNHLEQVKLAIEHGRYDPESPGFVLSQMAANIQGSNGGGGQHSPLPAGPDGATSLSMLQMTTTPVNNGHDLMELSSRQNSRMLMQV